MKSVFALDLGTSKIVVSGMVKAPGTAESKLEVVSVNSEGMEAGTVASVQSLKNAIFEAVTEFEGKYGIEIKRVTVGVTGRTLKVVPRSLEFSGKNKVIDDAKLQGLIAEVVEGFAASDLTPLVVWPKFFNLDQRDPVRDPRGMICDSGVAYYQVVTADGRYVSDILRACNEAGLQVEGIFPESMASALVTTTFDERERGICVLDIGHGSCDGIIFKGGLPVHIFSLPTAGMGFTLSLSQTFAVSLQEAEKLKIFFGMKAVSEEDTRRISVKNISGTYFTPNPQEIRSVLLNQSRALCGKFVQEVKDSKSQFSGGIVLTGGGSSLDGIVDHWGQLLKVPVCVRAPSFLEPTVYSRDRVDQAYKEAMSEFRESIENFMQDKPFYSTVLGLIFLQTEIKFMNSRTLGQPDKAKHASKIWHIVAGWIKELS